MGKDFVVLENLLNQNVKFGQKLQNIDLLNTLLFVTIFSSFFIILYIRELKKKKKYS